jgi:hypothetical protein
MTAKDTADRLMKTIERVTADSRFHTPISAARPGHRSCGRRHQRQRKWQS